MCLRLDNTDTLKITFRAATIKLVHVLFIFWGNTIQKYINCRIFLFNFVNWAYFSINTNGQLYNLKLFLSLCVILLSVSINVYLVRSV